MWIQGNRTHISACTYATITFIRLHSFSTALFVPSINRDSGLVKLKETLSDSYRSKITSGFESAMMLDWTTPLKPFLSGDPRTKNRERDGMSGISHGSGVVLGFYCSVISYRDFKGKNSISRLIGLVRCERELEAFWLSVYCMAFMATEEVNDIVWNHHVSCFDKNNLQISWWHSLKKCWDPGPSKYSPAPVRVPCTGFLLPSEAEV